MTQFGFTYSNTTSLVLDNLDSVINLSIWGNSSLTNLNLIDLNSLDKIAQKMMVVSTPAGWKVDLEYSFPQKTK